MTVPTDPYSGGSRSGPSGNADASSQPGSTAGPGRVVTGPMREIGAVALLGGNAVFLFLGVSDLLFVVRGWAGGFGTRSEAVFGTFAGPVAIALPLLAMLLATHVSPPLRTSRTILLVALGEYAVSAFFGVITYLGAFANALFAVRATFDGLLARAVWLAFLTIAATAVYRVVRAMYPPRPKPVYGHAPPVYGRPYPGQPTYPQPTYRPGPVPAVPPQPPVAQPPAPAADDPARRLPPATPLG